MEFDQSPESSEPASEFTRADADQLKILAVLHFVYAGFVGLSGCCLSIYVLAGLALATGKLEGNRPPPAEIGWLISGVGGVGMLVVWGSAVLVAIAGRKLLQRRGRQYCIVVAAVLCLGVPIGTALGIFTLIVLLRPGVTQEFERSSDFR